MNPLDLIYQHYDDEEEVTRILLTHSRLVADAALEAAARVPELNPDLAFIEEAAMLHDIGIRFTAAPDIDCHGPDPYIQHGVIGSELVREAGFPRHALVCERHTGTGLSIDDITRQELPLPQRDMQPQSIEEILICYADKFYSKKPERLTKRKSSEKILKKLSRLGQDKAERFAEWHHRFGS